MHSATAPLVVIGDAFHDFIDEALICTAVLSSAGIAPIVVSEKLVT